MGSTPMTAPMLTTACPAIHATVAAEDRRMKGSFTREATRSPA